MTDVDGAVDLRQLAASAAGSPVVRFAEHTSSYGSSRKAYVAETAGCKVFVRCAVPGLGLEGTLFSLSREAAILGALADAGLPVPRPLRVSDDGSVVCLEWLDGEVGPCGDHAARMLQARKYVMRIEELRDLDPGSVFPAELSIAKTVADAVAIELQRWRDIATSSFLGDPVGAWLLDWLESHRTREQRPPAVVHGDAGHGNFLVEHDRVSGLVDWELSHLGDPIEDIACMQMRSLGRDAAVWRAALGALAHSTEATDELRLRWERVHVLVRSAIAMRRSVERGSHGRDEAPFARFEVENLLLALREVAALAAGGRVESSPELSGLVREAERRCAAFGEPTARVADAATAFGESGA